MSAIFTDYRVTHVKRDKSAEENLGNYQPGVLLVVGGHRVYQGAVSVLVALRRVSQARIYFSQNLRSSMVGHTEFPVFIGRVDAIEKALALIQGLLSQSMVPIQ